MDVGEAGFRLRPLGVRRVCGGVLGSEWYVEDPSICWLGDCICSPGTR